MWSVEFYEKANGVKPVEDFLNELDNKMRAKAIRDINLLKEFGNTLREPYSKHVGDGIFELRIQMAGDITRILYFFYIEKRIILTNGFIKKTNKTPKSEIDRALKYKFEYINERR